MKVIVTEYNPEWPQQFEEIKRTIEEALSNVEYISIEHVGSTSVPGLAAKPIIDLSVISERTHVQAAIQALSTIAGYDYFGERGIPDRHAFKKADAVPQHNLYVSVVGCQSIRNQLAVRDICRNDPLVRDAYGKTKLELARQVWRDVDEYCEAKNDILSWVLSKAGMNSEDISQIREVNTLAAT